MLMFILYINQCCGVKPFLLILNIHRRGWTVLGSFLQPDHLQISIFHFDTCIYMFSVLFTYYENHSIYLISFFFLFLFLYSVLSLSLPSCTFFFLCCTLFDCAFYHYYYFAVWVSIRDLLILFTRKFS